MGPYPYISPIFFPLWYEVELNHRHADFQSAALPAELSHRLLRYTVANRQNLSVRIGNAYRSEELFSVPSARA